MKKTWKDVVLFTFMLIGLLVLSTRFLTLLHEVMGHGFTALILGGKVLKIKVSLFGGGRVWADINNIYLSGLIRYKLFNRQ